MGCMHPQLHLYRCSRPTDFLCIFRTFMFAIAGEIDCQVVNTQKYWIFSFRSFVPETPVKDARSLDSAGGSAPKAPSSRTNNLLIRLCADVRNCQPNTAKTKQRTQVKHDKSTAQTYWSNVTQYPQLVQQHHEPISKKVCWWCLCTMWSRLLLNRMQAQYTSCALTS